MPGVKIHATIGRGSLSPTKEATKNHEQFPEMHSLPQCCGWYRRVACCSAPVEIPRPLHHSWSFWHSNRRILCISFHAIHERVTISARKLCTFLDSIERNTVTVGHHGTLACPCQYGNQQGVLRRIHEEQCVQRVAAHPYTLPRVVLVFQNL